MTIMHPVPDYIPGRRRCDLAPCSILAVCVGLAAVFLFCPPTRADIVLNYQYSGAINLVDDPYGLFSQIAVGDPVSGSLRLCASSRDDDFGGLRSFYFDSSAGNQFNVAVGTSSGLLDLRPSSEFLVDVYGPDWSAGEFAGTVFQFWDGDTSPLDHTGLPAGWYAGGFGALAGFLTTNLSLSTYPHLPTSLHASSDYDYDLIGFLFVDVYNTSGGYEGSSFSSFSISSIQPVPEPGSSIVWLVIGLITATFRRRTSRTG